MDKELSDSMMLAGDLESSPYKPSDDDNDSGRKGESSQGISPHHISR